MNINFELSQQLPHDSFDVWRAMNDSEADLVSIHQKIEHSDLDDEGNIIVGSRIIIHPDRSHLPLLIKRLIKPMVFKVKEIEPPRKINRRISPGLRRDVSVDNDLLHGDVTRRVQPNELGSIISAKVDIKVTAPEVLVNHFMNGNNPQDLIEQHITLSLENILRSLQAN